MLDDLDGLTLRNAVEAFNRTIASARQFYLQLHQHPGFIASGIQPDLGDSAATSPRMLRDGRSDWIGQPEASFKTNVILATYTHPDLTDVRARLFVAFDLVAHHETALQLLAGRWDYANNRPTVDPRQLAAALTDARSLEGVQRNIPCRAEKGSSRWTYNRRAWMAGQASEDLDWTTSRMIAAASIT